MEAFEGAIKVDESMLGVLKTQDKWVEVLTVTTSIVGCGVVTMFEKWAKDQEVLHINKGLLLEPFL